jgi:hypothetical protein
MSIATTQHNLMNTIAYHKNIETPKIYSVNLILLLVSVFLLQCNSKEADKVRYSRSFQKQVTLKGQAILPEVFAPTKIIPVGELLLVALRRQDYLYRIFDKKTLSPLGVFARRGDGKDEWKATYLSTQVTNQANGTIIWLNEIDRMKVYKINLTESLQRDTTVILSTFSYSSEIDLTQEICVANDTLWFSPIALSDTKPLLFRSYNPIKKSQREILPNVNYEAKQKLLPEIHYPLFFNNLAISRKHNRLVSVMNCFDRLDIYNWEGTLLKSVVGSEDADHLQLLQLEEQYFTMYYTNVYATDNKIYAIYYDQPNKEYGKKMIKTHIHIFDWEGNGLYDITVDEYLFTISVDEEDGWIYGVDFYNEKNMRYPLGELK